MTGTLRGRLAVAGWLLTSVTAGAFGLLLVEEEPGATAARWYLVSALGFAAIAIWLRMAPDGRHGRWILVAAAVATLATAAHTAWIVAFAYQGLSTILLVLAVLASVATTLAVLAAGRAAGRARAASR